MYDPKKGYLDTFGDNGVGGQYVTTANSKNRDNGSGTWKILSAANKVGVVKYGDLVFLQNQFGTNKGFLDTRGRINHSNCYFNVETSKKANRDQGSGTWEINSKDPNKKGLPLLVGDDFHLINQYDKSCGYLDTFGYIRTGFGVQTFNTPDRDPKGSGTWQFIFTK